MNINKQEAQNLLVFLSRVDLKGNEAIELVKLQQKLTEIMDTPEKVPVEKVKSV